MSTATIKEVFITDPEYAGVYELREEILRKPLGLSLENEDLSADRTDHIIAAIAGNKVIGCVMLQPKTGDTIKLRQMAVAAEWQGKGIGRQLVNYAEDMALRKNYRHIILHARDIAEGFYKTLGYTVVPGDPFTEVGIPHVVMEKILTSPGLS